jgi:hypothetical protein
MIPVILVKLKAFSSTKHNQKDLLKKKKKKKKERFTWAKHLGDDILHGTAICKANVTQKETHTLTGLRIFPSPCFAFSLPCNDFHSFQFPS